MTISFDFDAPDQYFAVDSIPPNTEATRTTIGTVLLASADFPLQAGRVVYVSAEFVGVDSNGVGLAAKQSAAVTLGHVNIRDNANATQLGDAIGIVWMTLNGDNDLVVAWQNLNTTGSGITHDVSARITLRWSGS